VLRTINIAGLAIVILTSVVLTSCRKGASDSGGQVLARVGSHEIKESDVDNAIKQQLGASGGTFGPEELISARLNVLSSLIQTEALFAKAEKETLVPDDGKVNEEVQKRIKESKLTKEDFERQLSSAGITESQWRDQLRKELAITALVDKHVKNAATEQLTDAEIKKYYDDHRSEFVALRGVDVSIIVTDPRNNATRDDAIGDAQAEQKIRDIYAQLKAGSSDFGAVALQRSEHPSAVRNGNLGFAAEDDLKQAFPTLTGLFQQLIAMRPGEYTAPMKETAAGAWLIFKLNEKREQPRNLTLDDASVRQGIIDAVNQARQQVLQTALVTIAMTETEIKNLLAERILSDPKTIGQMRPSQLLQQATPKQPQPRIENENQTAPTAGPNSAASSNTNKAAVTNGNKR
jgi:hypothetical protein